MVRFLKVILLMGCLVVQMRPQAPKPPVTAAAPAPAAAAKTQYPLDSFTDFSAIMIGSRMEAGEGTKQGYIYRSGKLMRAEGPEGRGYFITDLTTGETFGQSAAGCMHDSRPFFRVSPFPAAAHPGTTVTLDAAGEETVDGHSCHVENVTVASPQLPVPLKMRFWEAEDLQGFPIKIEFLNSGGRDPIVRYKNVVLGSQDPTLFIHPSSCEPLMGSPPTKKRNPSPADKKPVATSPGE